MKEPIEDTEIKQDKNQEMPEEDFDDELSQDRMFLEVGTF